MWKIGKDAEDVVYAVDYNVRKERHLNGTSFDAIHRPALLITDASSIEREVPNKTTRDAKIVDSILSSLRALSFLSATVTIGEKRGRYSVRMNIHFETPTFPCACCNRVRRSLSLTCLDFL